MSARKKSNSNDANRAPAARGTDEQSQDSWEPEYLFESDRKAGDGVGIVESLQQQVDGLRTQLARAQADFANLRKRDREEQTRTVIYANESLMSRLLPILDDFERALSAANGNGSDTDNEFATGIAMIHDRFLKLLTVEGLEPVDTTGERFDPFLHEAVLTRKEEGAEPGSILEECQKGFLFHGRLLRAAQVVVVPGTPSPRKKREKKEKPAEAAPEPEPEVEVEIEVEIDAEPPSPFLEELDAELAEEKTTPTADPIEELMEAAEDSAPLAGEADSEQEISEESENTFVTPPPSAADWEMDENLLDDLDEDDK